MTAPLRFLIAENEPSSAREVRRCSVGRSSGETYLNVLKSLAPGAHCDRIKPADSCADLPGGEALAGYDGIFLTGSPLHLYEATTATRREVVFMRDVFASGTPSFGSCAGLQVATVAAGGSVRQNVNGREAAFARRITPTEAGRVHPLLEGRPAAFDAPAIHTDEVESLPEGALLLASNGVTSVQAAEIRSGDEGLFWGVQYHPELGLDEVAAALRREAEDLVKCGLARSPTDVESYAKDIDDLHQEPERRDLAWRLGLNEQVTNEHRRRVELRNFIAHLVKPKRSERGRG
jgi:GMP synthase (glutamine-hydrolysing)